MEAILGVQAPGLVVLGSILLGAVVLAITYFANRREQRQTSGEAMKSEIASSQKEIPAEPAVSSAVGVGNKRGKNKKRREAQQEFTHSWMVGALKGHSAPVLDMNFASNGKFLASCAEDCDLVPEELDPGGGSSGGESECQRRVRGKPKASTKTSSPPKNERAILSRRQRKNRTRAPREPGGAVSTSSGETSGSSPGATPPTGRNQANPSNAKSKRSRASAAHTMSKHLPKFNLSDGALAALLHRYTLRGDQLAALGYPVESAYCPGRAIILKEGFAYRGPPNLDVNAREFVPGCGKTYSEISASWSAERSGDSGNCSSSSLESSDLDPESSDSDIVETTSSSQYSSSTASTESTEPVLGGVERQCVRCFSKFHISCETGEYLTKERCVYHWGKFRNRGWDCCGAGESSRGCSAAKLHVWSGVAPGVNGPFDGYVRTRTRKTPPQDGNYGVYALDCEMCFTQRGLELAKVTVVGIDGRLVYDSLVRPEVEVIDHNTRFSGITAKDLTRAPKTLRDVQNDLMGFINADTILIGHGLENDLRALRMLHSTIVDTVVAFPHFLGLPYKRSLKSLARSLLRRDIQGSYHDSMEDARAAAELMLWRLRRDLS